MMHLEDALFSSACFKWTDGYLLVLVSLSNLSPLQNYSFSSSFNLHIFQSFFFQTEFFLIINFFHY